MSFPEKKKQREKCRKKEQAKLFSSEQAQSQYDIVKKFCAGEYEGDAEALLEAMGEGFTPSEVIDTETGALLSKKVEETYYQILTEGTGSYVPTGMEAYISVELNMMNEKLKRFSILNSRRKRGRGKRLIFSQTWRQQVESFSFTIL